MLSALEKGWRLVLRRVHLVPGARENRCFWHPPQVSVRGRTSWSLYHEPGIVLQSQGMEVIKILDGTL